MNFGIVLPGGTAAEQLEQAVMAEENGWDGVFVWEAAFGVDAWALLGAMAARTNRVRLGTMLTPLPWRRPWKVASQVVTLDQLTGGRAILAVGLGAVTTDLPTTGRSPISRAVPPCSTRASTACGTSSRAGRASTVSTTTSSRSATTSPRWEGPCKTAYRSGW